MTQQYLILNQPKQQNAAVVPYSTTGAAVAPLTEYHIATTWPLKCVVKVSEVETIPAPVYFAGDSPLAKLAELLQIGRRFHDRAPANYFVWQRPYDRNRDYYENLVGSNRPIHTCAVAAAYAGAFGPQAVEQSGFSWSEAVWRLNRHIGYNLDELLVVGPTRRQSTIYDEMILLNDANGWSRAGVAEWLPTAAIVQGRVMS